MRFEQNQAQVLTGIVQQDVHAIACHTHEAIPFPQTI
jgi:hypothetical protein